MKVQSLQQDLVSKDVPPYTIVGGNPAKEIKKQFTDTEMNMLMEMRWFDWERIS